MRLELSFSSEHPVRRYLDGDIGDEILDHKASSVRLDRLRNGGPVLIDHRNSVDSLVGVVEKVSLKEKKGRATVRFHDDDHSRIVFNKAKSGILRNVSVGYEIHNFIKERDRDGNNVTFRITDWEPMEISMVAVPADPTVGPGRAVAPYSARVMEPLAADPPAPDDPPGDDLLAADRNKAPTILQPIAETTMTEEEKQEALRQAREAGATAERERVSGIRSIVKTYPQLADDAERAIHEGKTIEDFRTIALDRIHNAKPMPAPPQLGLSDKEVRAFSVVKLLRALAFGHQEARFIKDASFELEVTEVAARIQQEVGVKRVHGTIIPMDVLNAAMMPRTDGNMASALRAKFPELARALNIQQRLLTAGTATDGAELVAEELLSGSFIDVLRNASFVIQAGATVLTDLNGNIAIPRKVSGSVAAWLATEGVSEAAQSEPQFDQVTMTPHNLAVYAEYSRQLLLQSSLDIENLLRTDLAAGMATEVDRVSLYGSNSAGQPNGLATQTGVNAPGMAGANPTWAEVVGFETAVAVDNALRVNATSYMLKPDMRGSLKTTLKVSGDAGTGFIWDIQSPNNPLNGYPAWVTNQVVSGDLFFGYWPDLLIGMWGGLDVIVDPYTQARKGVVGITNHQSMDVAVRQPVSFAFDNDSA
jgi:HK97 family phage major capsid protein